MKIAELDDRPKRASLKSPAKLVDSSRSGFRGFS
jgi:hypothetical protein